MKKIRIIIVEDRYLAREEIKYLLSLHPDVQIVGEFADTASAWPLLEAGDVDGVFLDIDIDTEGSRAGLDLALRIDRLPLPNIPWLVFTTGFEEFALAAHQVRPFGYLVKPLDDAKIAQVLDKIRKIAAQQTPAKSTPTRIEVKHKTLTRGETIWCIKYLKPEEILYIQAENNANTVKLQLVQGEILDGVYMPLNRWKTEYALPEFIQIHKSHLVNLQHVNGHKPDLFRIDGHNVTFRGSSQELPVGKSYLPDLLKALGK